MRDVRGWLTPAQEKVYARFVNTLFADRDRFVTDAMREVDGTSRSEAFEAWTVAMLAIIFTLGADWIGVELNRKQK